METSNSVDTYLFHLLNGLLGKSFLFDVSVIFVAKYVIFILGVVVLLSLVADFSRESKKQFLLNLSTLISTVIVVTSVTEGIRALYHHSRPLLLLGASHILFESSYSFPSMHTILIFGVGTAVYFYNRPLAYFIYSTGLLVGIARIIAGVHYPFDILGGIILGVGSGLLVEMLLNRKRKGRKAGAH